MELKKINNKLYIRTIYFAFQLYINLIKIDFIKML